VIAKVLLSVRDLHKTFRGGSWFDHRQVRAVDGVSFDVAAGEVVALVGESGSGKTTLARLVARLERPSAGEIWWRGQNVVAEEPGRASLDFRAGVQMIFQDPFASLNPARRVRHHLERPLRLHGKTRTAAELGARIHSLLETVGLHPAAQIEQRFPHELSGGQRQRVSIARALAVDPALVLADEPTSMLDASLRGEIIALLGALTRAQARGMLYITHDLGAARAIADRVLVLFAGKVVESGPIAAVLDRPAHPYTAALLAALPQVGVPGAQAVPAAAAPLPGPGTAVAVTGCPYQDRCPRAQDRCRQEAPALTPLFPAPGSASNAVPESAMDVNRLVRCYFPLEPSR
jgi:peptide/nickel transport system ATP-binding protein